MVLGNAPGVKQEIAPQVPAYTTTYTFRDPAPINIPGTATDEEVRVAEQYGKSLGMAVAALDACRPGDGPSAASPAHCPHTNT